MVNLNFLTLGDLENEPISQKKWSVPLRDQESTPYKPNVDKSLNYSFNYSV